MIATQNNVPSSGSPKNSIGIGVGKTATKPSSGLASGTTGAVSIRRIELDELVKEFRDLLGEKNWSNYYLQLCKFLLGKLSKDEFHRYITDSFLNTHKDISSSFSSQTLSREKDVSVLKAKFIKYHNKFLLASLANAFRDPPNPASVSSDGFGYLNTLSGKNKAKNPKSLNSSDVTEHEKLKKDIMSLTIKERKRIKNISKNTNPKIVHVSKKFHLGQVAQERFELIPKIPAGVPNGAGNHKAAEGNPANKTAAKASKAKEQLPDVSSKKPKGKNVNQLSILVDKDDASSASSNSKNLNLLQKSALHNGQNTPTSATVSGNVTTWTQEIMSGFQTLLSTESYELPDSHALKSKMVGIMREHGLVGSINDQTVNIMLLGLENYLKNIIEAAIDTVGYRKIQYDNNGLGDIDYSNNSGTAPMDVDSTSSPTSPVSSVLPAGTANTTVSNTPKSKEELEEIHRKRKITLTTEDLYDTFKLTPHLIDPNGMLDRISTVILRDDDIYKLDTINSSGIVDVLPLNNNADGHHLKRKKLNPDTVKVLEKFNTTGLYSGEPDETIPGTSGTLGSLATPLETANGSIHIKNEPLDHIPADNSVPENEGSKDELLWLIHDLLA